MILPPKVSLIQIRIPIRNPTVLSENLMKSNLPQNMRRVNQTLDPIAVVVHHYKQIEGLTSISSWICCRFSIDIFPLSFLLLRSGTFHPSDIQRQRDSGRSLSSLRTRLRKSGSFRNSGGSSGGSGTMNVKTAPTNDSFSWRSNLITNSSSFCFCIENGGCGTHNGVPPKTRRALTVSVSSIE